MKGRGFSLIELLVVLAIVVVLAGIATPIVSGCISRAKAGRAQSDIAAISLACQQMLRDTDASSFRKVLALDEDVTDIEAGIEAYTAAFYCLLQHGRDAEYSTEWPARVTLSPVARERLGTSYVPNASTDPWGNLYQFHIGLWRTRAYGIVTTSKDDYRNNMPFRIYWLDDSIPAMPSPADGYLDADGNAYNYPAPVSKDIYVWSLGADGISGQKTANNGECYNGQLGAYMDGGGDDINNWDAGGSWNEHY